MNLIFHMIGLAELPGVLDGCAAKASRRLSRSVLADEHAQDDLAWRPVVTEWSIADQCWWTDLAQQHEDDGMDWRDREWAAFKGLFPLIPLSPSTPAQSLCVREPTRL